MKKNVIDAVTEVGDQLRRNNCIPFVGSGVSAEYEDKEAGKKYSGIPTAKQLLKELRNRHGASWIISEISFPQALSIFRAERGDGPYFEFLTDYIKRPKIIPLPAHHLIAQLPFKGIITTNWDILLEDVLDEEKYHRIVKDEDVTLLSADKIPLIKLHGSITDRNSIIATVEDMIDFFPKHPLLTNLIRVLCASRSLLFLGYSLEDIDLMQLFQGLKREIGVLIYRSYAVQKGPSEFTIRYWDKQGIDIIDGDATEFLRLLHTEYLLGKSIPSPENRNWIIKDPFLSTIFVKIRGLPTESQVIDGILDNILSVLNSEDSLENIKKRVLKALDAVIEHRPNYEALKKLHGDIEKWFSSGKTKAEMKRKVDNFIKIRNTGVIKIGNHGSKIILEIIEKEGKILLYSQSTRVCSVFEQWQKDIKGSRYPELQIYIAECRPKSPKPFQDSFEYAGSIIDVCKPINIKVVPDSSIAHYIMEGEIKAVFLGAHMIIEKVDGNIIIINTTGSLMITEIATHHGIPIYIFAEESKIVTSVKKIEVQYEPEENLISEDDGRLKGLKKRLNLGEDEDILVNPGYDKIDTSNITAPIFLITEKRKLKFENGKLSEIEDYYTKRQK